MIPSVLVGIVLLGAAILAARGRLEARRRARAAARRVRENRPPRDRRHGRRFDNAADVDLRPSVNPHLWASTANAAPRPVPRRLGLELGAGGSVIVVPRNPSEERR